MRRTLEILDPTEAALVDDLLDPLVDRMVQGAATEPEAGDIPGGFGGADLVVWAVIPLALQAAHRLLSALDRDRIHEIRDRGSLAGAAEQVSQFKFFVRVEDLEIHVGGSLERHRRRLPEIVDAIQQVLGTPPVGSDTVTRPPRPPRPAIRYQDFSIRIGPDGTGLLWSRVLPSSGGSARTRFRPPFAAEELPDVLSDLESGLRGSRNVHSIGDQAPNKTLRDVGSDLFRSLFQDGIRTAFDRSLSAAHHHGERLRIRLVLDPGSRATRALPWESLFDPSTDHFLSHDPDTPIVRYLETDAPSERRDEPVPFPLRVLVLNARPRDTRDLNWQEECARIEHALKRPGLIEPQIVGATTVSVLRDSIRRFSPHILHFIGHGAFPTSVDDGAVLLLGRDETSDRLTGAELATFLLGSECRLVVLNACDTASLPRAEGLDPYSDVAAALIRRRMAAVVAMQFPITDDAAIAFGGTFYDCLAAGDPIEAAVVEGRRAIYELDRRCGSGEWATPVLYLQCDHGNLFAQSLLEVTR